MKKKIAIIGSGNMGTAMAQLLAENGHDINIWSIEQNVLREIARRHTNTKQLPGVRLSRRIIPKPSYVECLSGADMVVLAVPSRVMRQVVKKIKPILNRKMIILSLTKGLDAKTSRTVAEQIIFDLLSGLKKRFANLTGPAVASEFVRHAPTAVEISSPNKNISEQIKKIIQSPCFKVNITKDLAGAAYCASLKNVYAIIFGIAQELGYGVNTRAMLFAAALAEMKNILSKIKADPATALSLSGAGDLAVTAYNPESRNVRYGRLIAKSKTRDPKKLGLKQTAEGYYTAPLAAKLLKKRKINAPLVFWVDRIIKSKKIPQKYFIELVEKLTFY